MDPVQSESILEQQNSAIQNFHLTADNTPAKNAPLGKLSFNNGTTRKSSFPSNLTSNQYRYQSTIDLTPQVYTSTRMKSIAARNIVYGADNLNSVRIIRRPHEVSGPKHVPSRSMKVVPPDRKESTTFENYFDILNSSKLQSKENTLYPDTHGLSREPILNEQYDETRNAKAANNVTFSDVQGLSIASLLPKLDGSMISKRSAHIQI